MRSYGEHELTYSVLECKLNLSARKWHGFFCNGNAMRAVDVYIREALWVCDTFCMSF